MAEPDAPDKEQQASPAEVSWHDKILGDAIGYTRGLVRLLDSLSEGFCRRGQELEELRHRLAILQSERRTHQEERTSLEVQIATLTAECEALRQEVTEGRAALEARAGEIRRLTAACEDTKRQAEELREIVRGLERQLGRERTSMAQYPTGGWRQEGEAPGDVAGAWLHPPVEPLPLPVSKEGRPDPPVHALVAERDELQAELERRDQELGRLRLELAQNQATLEAQARELEEQAQAAAQAVRKREHLQEVVRGLEWEKENTAQAHAARIAEIEGELARMREAAAQASQDQAALQERVVAMESQSAAPEPRQEEDLPPSRPTATRSESPPTAGPARASRTSRDRRRNTGMTVECHLEVSDGEPTRVLRGEVLRLNAMGLMGLFDERLPEGQRVVLRFAHGGEECSCHGRIVRVRASVKAQGGSPAFDHLIRFDTPLPGFPES